MLSSFIFYLQLHAWHIVAERKASEVFVYSLLLSVGRLRVLDVSLFPGICLLASVAPFVLISKFILDGM